MTIQEKCFVILGVLAFYGITVPVLKAAYKSATGKKLRWFDAIIYISGGTILIGTLCFLIYYFVAGLLGELD